MVIFDARQTAETPEALGEILPRLGLGSIYYHFIDARLRPPINRNDFSTWLDHFGLEYEQLSSAIQSVDPYFSSLTRTHHVLCELFQQAGAQQ
jgi:hypothetical protein